MTRSTQIFGLLLLFIYILLVDGHFGGVKQLKIQKRIVGGWSAGENEFPYQVSLRHKNENEHFCGGAIINNLYIVSASHCFYWKSRKASSFIAVVGTHHVDQPGVQIELSQLKLHEKFDVNLTRNDIALIRTAKIIVFSNAVTPIALPTQGDVPSGTKVIVSGWGYTEDPVYLGKLLLSPARPTSLQFLESTTIDLEQCRILFRDRKSAMESLDENNICVQPGNTFGVCTGDSGGPLVANNTLIGIVSWSIDCARGFPDVYTNVFNFIDWITKSMTGLDSI